MFFEYTRIEGCDRTSLNGSNVITIRPETKTQMVLGTNGSGKSSLLEIGFCPIPPDPDHFPEGGSVEQRIHHKGHIYTLKSTFAAKNSYSFIVDDGEEQNKGRTVTAQLDLIKLHLGYDKLIHKFVTGQIKFTALSPQERRDWFARFSPSNFDFAFAKYNLWKKELSTRTSMQKLFKSRILETKELLLPENERLELRSRSNELHETLEALLREPRMQTEPVSDLDLEVLVKNLDDVVTDFIFKEYPDTLGADSFDDLVGWLTDLKQEQFVLKGEMKIVSDRFTECDRLREMIQKSLRSDPVKLKQDLEALTRELAGIADYKTGIHPSLLTNASKVISELRTALSELPSDRYNDAEVLELKQIVFQKMNKVARAGDLLRAITNDIESIHECESVTCPSCSTSFKPGVGERALETLKVREENGNRIYTELEQDLEADQAKLEQVELSREAYQQLIDIRFTYQAQFPGLFAYLDSEGWTDLGKGMMAKLAIYDRDCANAEKKTALQSKIEWITAELNQANVDRGNVDAVMNDYVRAEKAYDEVHFRNNLLKYREDILNEAMETWVKYTNQYKLGIELYETLKTQLLDYVNHQGDLEIERLITRTKISLGAIELSLSEQDAHENLLKDYENQLEKIEIERRAYSRLIDEICPKKGLLGEQIQLQMSVVIRTVNSLIQRIWGYPLFLSPCTADENGIDYKIPMMVAVKPRADINMGSSSIKHVIDQAFILAGYYCMQLTDYPLHLDEFGASFDEVHRYNMLPVIKDLVDDNHFSQVFIISHQLDGQTAFPNSQTIIMDTRNIKFPHPYNLHVEFA